MTGAPHLVAVTLVIAGTAVIVASALGALLADGPFARLHFSTPITSLGAPLIAIGLSVKNGADLTTASVLFPIAMLFFTGPLLSSAIARSMAERDRTIDTGPQETGSQESSPRESRSASHSTGGNGPKQAGSPA